MKKYNKIFAIGTTIVFFFDIFTKFLINKYLTSPIDFFSILKIKITYNPNLAFGIPFPRVWTIVISIAAIIYFINLFVKHFPKKSKIELTGFSLLIGGTLGNLYERIFFGQVTDFITLFNFPNSNFADITLMIGAFIVVICMLREE
jgi:signal peptidase II